MPDPTMMPESSMPPGMPVLAGVSALDGGAQDLESVIEDHVEAARQEGNPADLLKPMKEEERRELESALNNMIAASSEQKMACPLVSADRSFVSKSLWEMVQRARRICEGFPSTPKAKKEGLDTHPNWEPPNIFANFAWSILETAKTRWKDSLFATRPYFQVRARRPEDQEAARSIENFMDYGHDVVGFGQGARAEIDRAAVDGTCLVYLYWDSDPDVEFVNREIVPFEDAFIDPVASSVQKARFVGRRVLLRYKDLRNAPGVDLESVSPGNTGETSAVTNIAGEINDVDTCEIIEVWFRTTGIPSDPNAPDQQIYKAWLKVDGNGEVEPTAGRLILLKRSDFWLNDYPFYMVTPIPRSGSPWGYPLLDRIAGLAEEINFIKTSRAISRAYSNCPVVETEGNTTYNNDPMPLAMYPGMKVPAGWRVKTFPDTTQGVVNEVQALLQDMQFISGVQDVMMGRASTSRQTAREVLTIADSGNLRFTDYANNIGTGYKEYIEMSVGMVLQWHARPEDFVVVLPEKDDEYHTFDRRNVLPSRVREKFSAGTMGGDGQIPEAMRPVGDAITGRVMQKAQADPLAILRDPIEVVIEREVRQIVKREFMFKYADPSVRFEKESKLQLLTQVLLPIFVNKGWNVTGLINRIAYLMGEDPDMLATLMQPDPNQMMMDQIQQMMSGRPTPGMGTPPSPEDEAASQLDQMTRKAGVAY